MSKKSKKGKTKRFQFGTICAQTVDGKNRLFPHTVLLPLAVENSLGKWKRLREEQEEAGLQFPPRPIPKAEAREGSVCRERLSSPWR